MVGQPHFVQPPKSCDRPSAIPAHATIPKDVRDVETADLRGYDAVVHLAALSNDPIGELSPDLTRSINLDASVRLAQAAKEAGVGRFVFASSCSMYGASDTEDLVDEEAPLKPLTEAKEDFERNYLKSVLQLTNGNISRAAQFAGRYRADFYKMLRKYGLHPSTTKSRIEGEVEEVAEEFEAGEEIIQS